MTKSIKNSTSALIGLIILFIFSITNANGGEVKVTANMRLLSVNDILGILHTFPKMVPEFLRDHIFNKKDSGVITGAFQFSKVEGISSLQSFFPAFHFYKGLTLRSSHIPQPYLMAISGDKRYEMPDYFNRLILDSNIEVNDTNMIALAKLFIILAKGSQPASMSIHRNDELLSFPEIIFLEGTRIHEWDSLDCTWMDVKIKCRIGDEISTWKFTLGGTNTYRGQFVSARVFVNDEIVRYYMINIYERK